MCVACGEASAHLERDALKHRARDVALVVRKREADERAARIVAPVRCEEPTEGGDKVDPLGGGDLGSELGDFRRRFDHSERVAEPVDANRAAGHRALPIGWYVRSIICMVPQWRLAGAV